MDIKDFKWNHEVFLIADDDVYSSLLLEKVIRKTGARVILAKDGAEALEKLLQEPYISVAIIDMVMPRLSGYEVVKKVKPMRPETIFVAYTADVMRLDKDRCREIGFYTCVSKPILPIKFLVLLSEAFSLRGEVR